MNQEHLILIYQYALLLAAEENWDQRELGPIHLLKFACLADLAHAKYNGGETYTGIEWKFHTFGPWSNPAHALIQTAADELGAETKTIPSAYDEGDFIRYVVRGDQDELKRQEKDLRQKLPLDIRGAIQSAVHEYKADTKKLLHAVYATVPMLMAAPGDILDFHAVVREPVAAYAVEERAPAQVALSKKKTSMLKSRMAELRKQCSQNFTRAKAERTPPSEPDSTGELAEVTAWLDQLAGPAFPEEGAHVTFAKEVWKSEARRGGTYDAISG